MVVVYVFLLSVCRDCNNLESIEYALPFPKDSSGSIWGPALASAVMVRGRRTPPQTTVESRTVMELRLLRQAKYVAWMMVRSSLVAYIVMPSRPHISIQMHLAKDNTAGTDVGTA